MPFSKWACFMDFFRLGGIYAYTNCSMIAWSATLNAFLLNSGVHSKTQLASGSPDLRLVVENCVLPKPSIGVSRMSYGKPPGLLPTSFGLGR